MNTHAEARNVLRRIADQRDEDIDLAESALALAALDRPRVRLEHYRHHLAAMVSEVGEARMPGDGVMDRVEALTAVLRDRYGYRGDTMTYDDLQNANLMRVIDRRKGLPVVLGILYIHAARGQGWQMSGLNFPGHFLVRLEVGAERAILDPFHAGMVRSASDLRGLLKAMAGSEAELDADHYEPVGNRDILIRLQNNLKLRLMRTGRLDRAIQVVETMLLFAPGRPEMWRDLGLMHAHVGNVGAAIDSLETFLERGSGDLERHRAAALLQELRMRLN